MQIASHSLKPTFATGLNMQQIVSYEVNGLQAYVDPTYQSFSMEDDGYTSCDSSPASQRESLFS